MSDSLDVAELVMLTREHAIAEFDPDSGLVFADRLFRRAHGGYRAFAQEMLDLYRSGTGRTRSSLHEGVRLILAADPNAPVGRPSAFARLLDDQSEFFTATPAAAARLREAVFLTAARHHPLRLDRGIPFHHAIAETYQKIAYKLLEPEASIDARLYGDIPMRQRLASYRGPTLPEALLAHYNVAQFKASLLRAESVVVWAKSDLKAVVRFAKLARLMHCIERGHDGSYRFTFAGPASVLRTTARYGAAMARFAGNLLSCRNWSLSAAIRSPRDGGVFRLEADSSSGLQARQAPPRKFDSQVEARFAQAWGDRARNGWTLHREDELIVREQTVFTPDFSLRRGSQSCIFFEIVGFWTPEYLAAKAKTLALFPDIPIILAIAKRSSAAVSAFDRPTVWYSKFPSVDDVLQLLEKPTHSG